MKSFALLIVVRHDFVFAHVRRHRVKIRGRDFLDDDWLGRAQR